MKALELRKLSKTELQARLKAEQLRLEELRAQLAGKKLKNVREISKAKKEIARIFTLVNELEAEQR